MTADASSLAEAKLGAYPPVCALLGVLREAASGCRSAASFLGSNLSPVQCRGQEKLELISTQISHGLESSKQRVS